MKPPTSKPRTLAPVIPLHPKPGRVWRKGRPPFTNADAPVIPLHPRGTPTAPRRALFASHPDWPRVRDDARRFEHALAYVGSLPIPPGVATLAPVVHELARTLARHLPMPPHPTDAPDCGACHRPALTAPCARGCGRLAVVCGCVEVLSLDGVCAVCARSKAPPVEVPAAVIPPPPRTPRTPRGRS